MPDPAAHARPDHRPALPLSLSGATLTPIDATPRLNLKCEPNRALALRDEHPAILPGYHMNKRHWNTVVLDGSLPQSLVRELIDHSYSLVVAALPGKARAALEKSGATQTPGPLQPSPKPPQRRRRR